MKLSNLLLQQLKKIGISNPEKQPPTHKQWCALLEEITSTYKENNDSQHTTNHSTDISSAKMKKTNGKISHENHKDLAYFDSRTDLPNRTMYEFPMKTTKTYQF